MPIHCSVPAKLILSGEHAVLYGAPALSLAIDLPTQCTLDFKAANQSKIEIHLLDYQQHQAWSFNQAWQQAQVIATRYHQFQQQQLGIRQVCQSPFDLVLLCLFYVNQCSPLTPGHWRLEIQSNAWVGRGLGSSAAVIVSVLAALFKQQQLDDPNALLQMAKTIESYQHGQSSGLDPITIFHGGLLRYQRGEALQHLPNHPLQAWLIDSGEPQSTTGECVAAVKTHYAQDTTLWQRFADCTQLMHLAWLQQNQAALKQAVHINQQLLTTIGVVPPKVTAFIAALQQQDLAAKICGAGSINGDAAGVIMAIGLNDPSDLCRQWGYRCQAIQLQQQGAHCVNEL